MDNKKQFLEYFIKKINFLNQHREVFRNTSLVLDEMTKTLNDATSYGVPNLLEDALSYYSNKNNDLIILDLIKLGANQEINDGSIINTAIVNGEIGLIDQILRDELIDVSKYILVSENILKQQNLQKKEIDKDKAEQNTKVLYGYLFSDNFDSFVNYHKMNRENIDLNEKGGVLFEAAKNLKKYNFVEYLLKNGAGVLPEGVSINNNILEINEKLSNYQKEYLINKQKQKENNNIQDELNDLVFSCSKNKIGSLCSKMSRLFKKYDLDMENEGKTLELAFDFAIKNNCKKAIDVFLGMEIFPEKYQKDIFINAIKEKNINRLLMIWNPKEDPLDISVYLNIKDRKTIKTNFSLNLYFPEYGPRFLSWLIEDRVKKTKCLNFIKDINSCIDENAAQKEKLFDDVMLFSWKKEKELSGASNINYLWCNANANIVSEDKKCEKEKTSFIKLIEKDIEEKKTISEEIVKEVLVEPVVNKKQEYFDVNILKNKIQLNLKEQKTTELKQEKKIEPLPTLTSFNGETLTRKEIQKRWDKFLINDFFAEGSNRKVMFENVEIFLHNNGLSQDMLIANDFTIHRMPKENKYQLEKFSRQFICSYVPQLAEILFNENKESVLKNEDKILRTIVKGKIRTQYESTNRLSSSLDEDIKEFKITTEKFQKMGREMALQSLHKSNNVHNWNICK